MRLVIVTGMSGAGKSTALKMLEELLPFHGVDIICGAKVTGFRDGKVSYETAGAEKNLEADSVVLCAGYRSADELYEEVKFEAAELYCLGDAEKVSNIMYAIWNAFEVANHI